MNGEKKRLGLLYMIKLRFLRFQFRVMFIVYFISLLLSDLLFFFIIIINIFLAFQLLFSNYALVERVHVVLALGEESADSTF